MQVEVKIVNKVVLYWKKIEYIFLKPNMPSIFNPVLGHNFSMLNAYKQKLFFLGTEENTRLMGKWGSWAESDP